jgi:sec-independent protein translocase protein TatA
MFGNLGFWEITILALVILLVFGAKRLPEIGQSLGKGIREFKRSFSDVRDSVTAPDDRASPGRQLDAPAEPPASSEPKRLSQ